MNMMARLFCVMCILLCAACESGTTDEDPTYDEPTTRKIGNQNYSLHNYLSYDDFGTRWDADSLNYYLGKAETYTKGLVDELSNDPSFKRRPTAQAYFSNLINNYQKNNNYHTYDFDPGRGLDWTITNNTLPLKPIFADIMKNLNGSDQRGAFYYSYRVLANEAYKYGLGNRFDEEKGSNFMMDKYTAEKNKITTKWRGNNTLLNNISLSSEYGSNDFGKITSLLDELTGYAADNMTAKGLGEIRATDLQKIINIALTTYSLEAMHDRNDGVLNHSKSCSYENLIVDTMYEASVEAAAAEKENGYTMGR
ncbi:MAG: hypothetical protein K2M90_06555 [Treponemataceae bacterium]|nr:hypothetical protein [Treponemataceae bacterium]